MSTRRLLPRRLALPPLPLLRHRPLSTKPNSAIARGLRRTPRPDEPRPQAGAPPAAPSGPRITRSQTRPRPPPVPTNGVWTPPGAPPRPKDDLDFPPPPPSRGAHTRLWTPPGSRRAAAAEEEEPEEEPEERERHNAYCDPEEDDARPPPTYNPHRPFYTAHRPFGGGSGSGSGGGVRSSPRLDAPPPDREWAPKPRRYIPKVDYDAEWIYGASVVEAALRAGRRKCLRLHIHAARNRAEEGRMKDRELAGMARDAGAEVVWEEDGGVLDSMSDSRPHNGYVLETHPLPKTPILALGPVSPSLSSLTLTLAQHTATNTPIPTATHPPRLYSRSPKPRYPLILLLDDILDPGNLGAILRSAYFLGVTAVSLSARNSARLSPVALKASAGAAEYLPLLEHARTERVVQASAEHGWTFYAAVPPVTRQQERRAGGSRYVVAGEVGRRLEEGPVALVVGGEGDGLRQVVRRECSFCVGLERAVGTERVVDSLNVSVASALLCHAFLKGK
ncbi:Alpha/beta knot methyltransferase [Morchella snyderi]|nr:Alpha/beta knot methyltransferase [Morchella snyderi]